MSQQRLIQALTSLDSNEIDRVFGQEASHLSLPTIVNQAPVRRVALFAESFFPKVDGVAKSAYLTLRYLQQTGREVMVFAPDIAPYNVGPSQVVPLPSVGLPFAPETRVAIPAPSIRAHLDAFLPDLIHLFSPVAMSVGGMWEGRRRNIPVIANYQTDLPAYTQHYGMGFLTTAMLDWLRYIHNGCHLTLAPSGYTMRQLEQQNYKRLRLWGRGVDLERFSPRRRSPAIRERLLQGRDPGSLVCLYVGRLASEKRIDLLVEIARLPGVVLALVGDGAERDNLEMLFEGTNAVFTGYMYGNDLADAYASADIFVFPGPSETFGQVVQEALASGLPAVIINQGGIIDLVTDGVNGFVCPADPNAFAQAVKRLQDSPDLRQRMSRQSRQFAERRPWPVIMSRLEGYYQEAVDINYQWSHMRDSWSLSQRTKALLQGRYYRIS
ncbi:MAG: glycosyltransferase family 1 protein [Chloroflexi bacterium]|nr:glycosyltransferase family 1 protein [Chloroflexota bacterium]